MELFVSNYYTSYLWNTGDSTSNIFVKNSGNYIVTAFDINGCSASSNPFVVNASYLQPPDICIVGVDTMNNNRIIWEKSLTQPIDSFKVYRESTSAGIYDLIDSKSFNEIALSLDTASNSSIRSYNYQITALDTCGMESPPSYIHKTIHLSINAGLNGAWNLIWNHYEGFSFGTYNIYRGTSPNNLSLLTSLPSSINSYTDISPPTGTIYYQIEIVKASGCYPDSVFTKANTNYNSSRSNMADNGSIAPIYLNADFNADLQTGQWPFKVQFSDLSTGSPDSWYWNFGDGNYSIEQNPNHTYNNTGMYSVSLVACNYNLCDTMVKSNLIDVKPNGVINIFRTINAEIYPNPSNGIFTLAIHEKINQKANLIIYNSLGQIAYQSNLNLFNNLHHKLDLSTQAKGVYFVHLSTDNGVVYREKVVVQ
jgi:PKD repeat protein